MDTLTTTTPSLPCGHLLPLPTIKTKPLPRFQRNLLALLLGKPSLPSPTTIHPPSKTYPPFYDQGLAFIAADYRRQRNDIIFEAWALGWGIGDVGGRLSDLAVEEGEVREEWVATFEDMDVGCGVLGEGVSVHEIEKDSLGVEGRPVEDGGKCWRGVTV